MVGKLEIRLLNYFLLIAFAAMLIGVEFFFELNKPELISEILEFSSAQSGTADRIVQAETPETSSPIIDLRNKIAIMLGVLTIVVAIVLMMFIKNITKPLCKMAEVASQINKGDLSQTVPIENKDEIGQVGEAINELTSNLQEVAKFTATTSNEVLIKLENLSKSDKTITQAQDELEDVKQTLASLVEFVDSFKLLNTDINR